MPTGIYKREPIIKKGEKHDRLTAVKFHHKDKWSHQYWLFRCDCGNEKVIVASDVKRNIVKSCGCLQRETITTHGMYYSREYSIWGGMEQRCLNRNNHAYKNYGGRGIKVCNRWLKFENFYKDMGECPVGKTLDRIDNNGNYKPSNCRWATVKEQNNNRRNNHLLTFKGKTQTIAQWAKEIGINRATLSSRIYKGWSVERALTN